MAKTAFQAIASKAEKFVWSPAENQDYRGVLDPPDPGSGSSFDKQSNKTFTMNVPGNNNAPGKPFELKVNDGSSTTWVGGGSARAPSIDIQSGTFIHSGNCISGADLVLGLDYILFLRASADAICSLTGLNGVESPGGLNVSLGDRSTLKMQYPSIRFASSASSNISIDDNATMQTVSSFFEIWNFFVSVYSAGRDGSVMNWRATDSMAIRNSTLDLNGASVSLLQSSVLTLDRSRITTSNKASCSLQISSLAGSQSDNFTLGKGTTKFQFANFDGDVLPPAFYGNIKQKAVFNFSLDASPTSQFAFRTDVPNDIADGLLFLGLLGINGAPQTDKSKFNMTSQAGYLVVTRKV
jgi:hypothetical protein